MMKPVVSSFLKPLSLAFVAAIAASTLGWSSDEIPIRNFSEVSPGVYRGGAPDDAGTAYLASIGLKTDIDLESFRWPVVLDEATDDAADNIKLVSEPLFSLPGILSFIQPPITNHRINKILKLMSDPERQPVFVHCELGDDRTGLVVGLYRVLVEKWKPEDAWAEMLKFGYHPHFEELTKYFEKRTHWKPDAEN